jgi:hypothetical protein
MKSLSVSLSERGKPPPPGRIQARYSPIPNNQGSSRGDLPPLLYSLIYFLRIIKRH